MHFYINFFRNRKLERIDYADVILYFEKELNCQVIYSEEDVKFIYKDEVFNLEYNFYITKRSRVSNVSIINPEYVNIRFYVEIDLVLPEHAYREALSLIDRICNRFNFVILYDGIKDVEELDILKVQKYLINERTKFLVNNPNYHVLTLPSNIITHIANYHQLIPFLNDKIEEDVSIKKYLLLDDGLSNDAKLGIELNVGEAIIIPPHLDYIRLIYEDSIQYLSSDIFFKYCLRYGYELKNYIPDASLLMFYGKGSKKIVSKLRKFKKHYIQDLTLKEIKSINLIEK